MNRILGKSFSFILLCLISTVSFSAVDIIVRSDRNPVHIDESFQLVFEANGSVDDDPDFSPLKVLLDVVRQSESSNISLINGSMSRSKTWTLTVMPKALGDIQIPSISFGDDKSLPLLINVKKADQAQMGNASFFISLDSDVKSSIEQAQIVATVRVFSDKSLNEISISTMQFNHGDVVIEVLGDEKSFQTNIKGKAYLVIEQKIAIFPQKPGALVIQPMLAVGEVRSGTRTFFGDPAGKPVRARSESLAIDVQAKPDVPLWLPAKSLSLKDEWLSDPSQFIVGEPITRVLTLTSQGLTAAQLPELEITELDSIKMYPDQDQLKNKMTDLGIVGIRQEKIAYIPSKAGEFILPAMSIPWWDTQSKKWQTAQIQEQVITVKPSTSFIEQAPIVTKTPEIVNNIDEETPPVAEINERITDLKSSEPWWKWLAMFFAIAWVVTIGLLFKNRQKKPTEMEQVKVVKPSFKLSDLKVACKEKNAKICKLCVINWANYQFDNQHFTQLADLQERVSDELYIEIKNLEACLYSGESVTEWNADVLYQKISENCSKNKATSTTPEKNLEPLHLS